MSEETATTPNESTEPQDTEEHTPDPRNAEAARYRRQLRDTEAELETTRAELDQLREERAERRAAGVRQALTESLRDRAMRPEVAQALVEAQDASAFLTDEGEIDAETVTAFADKFPRDYSGWTTGGSGDRDGKGKSAGWADVIGANS